MSASRVWTSAIAAGSWTRSAAAQQALALGVGGEHGRARAHVAARRLLRDRADPRAAPQAHLAGIRSELAPDQPQQRGLAAAVAPDQADPVPGRQMDARVLEQQAAADPQGHVVEMQHGARDIARARRFAQRLRNGSVEARSAEKPGLR